MRCQGMPLPVARPLSGEKMRRRPRTVGNVLQRVIKGSQQDKAIG